MSQAITESFALPTPTSRDALTEVLHKGARQMLIDAIEGEVSDYLAERAGLTDTKGHRHVVRNGHLPERELQTPIGPMPVKQPRVRDKRSVQEREKFTSRILPPYLRRTRSIEELIAIADGYRESKQSLKELLLDVQSRGLSEPPKLAIGDGALGFWSAVREVWPAIDEQRCWVHKAANVLNRMPNGVHGKAKGMLHQIWMAETRAEATRAFDLFLDTFGLKHPGACDCLAKDRQALLTFYDYPAEHWMHLRTTNPIENTFATVRLRTACLTMVFKLTQSAERHWRVLNGSHRIPDVIIGVSFVDGVKHEAA